MRLVLLAASYLAVVLGKDVKGNVEYGPFKTDFSNWLKGKGNNFAFKSFETYGATGSFGGKDPDQKVVKTPVIFIHGNADSALDTGALMSQGWTATIPHFLEAGYTFAELYGLTYGARNISLAADTKMSCEWIKGHREFVLYVLDYTAAPKVNIIGHSMGATIARSLAKGGLVEFPGEDHCDLGSPINDKIDVFIGVAGAHFGMCMCVTMPGKGSCDPTGGFWPGGTCGGGVHRQCAQAAEGECRDMQYGDFLRSINNSPVQKEAGYVFSFFSHDDNVLGPQTMTWGRMTSIIPHEDDHMEYTKLDHFQMKEASAKAAIFAFENHKLPPKRQRGLQNTGLDLIDGHYEAKPFVWPH
ncbi:unnamed protein product, partial [Mesorhabditis spiculigera]